MERFARFGMLRLPVGVLVAVLGQFLLQGQASAKQFNIWFAPTRPAVQANGRHTGSADYDQLFEPGSPWQQTASKITVFKTYQSYINNEPVESLRKFFTFLAAHKIKVAVELGPMSRLPGHCWINAEGWGVGGHEAASRLVDKIRRSGGYLDYIAMDEPYWNGRIRPPPGSCSVSALEMAQNAKLTVDAVHAVFPNTQFGDIEPVQALPGVNLVADYAQWLDTWQQVMGTPLAFFHEDIEWDHTPNEEIAAIGRMTHSRHVPFGIIYNGPTHAQSTPEWLNDARAHIQKYEQANDPLPDQPVLQSWNFFPDHVLPEGDATAHTHLVLEYVNHRLAKR